jgi:protein-glucosylgalactosylhydroxylysine glucosidase
MSQISSLQEPSNFRFSECLCGKNESNDKWNEIAEKLEILYDPQFDYHPQFEGFAIGTEIKQADAVLIGYPLQFPMNSSTRVNDLKIYGNATRRSGPAMTSSMMAINYLDVDNEAEANEMLRQSYKPFIRQPFNVWNEVVEGEIGATNFITGAGGFLQAIFNGFMGIRVHLDRLEINSPKLPESCSMIKVAGFSYLNSKFELKLEKHEKYLRFYELNDRIEMKIDDSEKLISENELCELNREKIVKCFYRSHA